MALNLTSQDLEPLPMAESDEFASLVQSARDLRLPVPEGVRYASRNTVLNGQRFHFLEWGDPANPPVVLVHGGHQSAHSWDLVSLALAGRYQVFALDQRGHGDSEWAKDGDYRSSTMAGDLRAFIRSQGLDQPIVTGHSLGGIVSMTMLRDTPELARALVVVDVSPEPSGEGGAAIWNFIQTAREFDDLEDFIAKVQVQDPFRSRAHIERTVRYNMLRRADGRYINKCDAAMFAARRGGEDGGRIEFEQLDALSMPALVVRGEQSTVLLADAAERFARRLPAARLATVPRCGHNVHSQNTAGFLEAVEPFLAEF